MRRIGRDTRLRADPKGIYFGTLLYVLGDLVLVKSSTGKDLHISQSCRL